MLKFVESQKKLKSCIIKSNEKATYSYTGVDPYNGRGTGYRHCDFRFDGNRVKDIWTMWGDRGSSERDLAKENAVYQSWLWDGEKGYELSLIEKNRLQTAKSPGTLQIREEESIFIDSFKKRYRRTMISPVLGYVMGNDQDIGIMFLRTDANVKLLDKRSKVNGVDCYVIEAEVPQGGKYRVWIDPVHDFNLARLRSKRKTGDLYLGKLLKKDVYWNNFYEVLEFQEVKGVWLPKTFKMKDESHDGGYDFDYKAETKTELYEVNLDPDHEKERSFLTDDIPNGTRVRLERVPLKNVLTWQDGKVIDFEGKVVEPSGQKPEQLSREK
ncbi:MAG: hypothetical protein ACYTER_02375 [Planctomycetota bacterium]